MRTERMFAGAALSAFAATAAAGYTHAPFHERPYEVADLALRVLEGDATAGVPADDVPLAAAVAAFLLVSEMGLAEAYEEAVEGDDEDEADASEDDEGDGFAAAHAMLQTVRPWVAAVASDAEVTDLMGRLDALLPVPGRPEAIDADPEAGEVIAQALVGQLERAADSDLYLGRDLARALGTVAGVAAEACAGGGDARARRFEVAAIYYEDALEAPLSVMATEEAERIEDGLEALLEGNLAACDDVGAAFDDAARRLFP